MKRVAFYVQKGGTGKTTLSGNVSHVLARSLRTVLVDCDPQGNASSWFLTAAPRWELADVLQGRVKVQDALVPLGERLAILPTFGLNGTLKQYAEGPLNDEPYIFEELGQQLEQLSYRGRDLRPLPRHEPP